MSSTLHRDRIYFITHEVEGLEGMRGTRVLWTGTRQYHPEHGEVLLMKIDGGVEHDLWGDLIWVPRTSLACRFFWKIGPGPKPTAQDLQAQLDALKARLPTAPTGPATALATAGAPTVGPAGPGAATAPTVGRRPEPGRAGTSPREPMICRPPDGYEIHPSASLKSEALRLGMRLIEDDWERGLRWPYVLEAAPWSRYPHGEAEPLRNQLGWAAWAQSIRKSEEVCTPTRV